ncbi:hypothetical protein [Cupriavidus necator]
MSTVHDYIIGSINLLAGIIFAIFGVPKMDRNVRGGTGPWLPFGKTSALKIWMGYLVRLIVVGVLVAITARIILLASGVPKHLDDAQFWIAKISFCMGILLAGASRHFYWKRRG